MWQSVCRRRSDKKILKDPIKDHSNIFGFGLWPSDGFQFPTGSFLTIHMCWFRGHNIDLRFHIPPKHGDQSTTEFSRLAKYKDLQHFILFYSSKCLAFGIEVRANCHCHIGVNLTMIWCSVLYRIIPMGYGLSAIWHRWWDGPLSAWGFGFPKWHGSNKQWWCLIAAAVAYRYEFH